MEQERVQLQHQAACLAEQLDAVLADKFVPRPDVFDSDTPIDKTLAFLQQVIKVSVLLFSCCTLDVKHLSQGIDSYYMRLEIYCLISVCRSDSALSMIK